jgi:hypothetical protein
MHLNFLAAVSAIADPKLESETSKAPGLLRDSLLPLGACVILFVLLAVGARFYLKRRRRHSHRHSTHPNHAPSSSKLKEKSIEPVENDEMEEEGDDSGPDDQRQRRRHRKRKRLRDHRLRNPTLADTGGLPPKRAPGEIPPSL